MGVKKSTVCTSARLAEILYTPASSALSKPTRTLGSCCRANFPSTKSSAAGLSLLAQPAAFTASVRRTGLLEDIRLILAVRSWREAVGTQRSARQAGASNPPRHLQLSAER